MIEIIIRLTPPRPWGRAKGLLTNPTTTNNPVRTHTESLGPPFYVPMPVTNSVTRALSPTSSYGSYSNEQKGCRPFNPRPCSPNCLKQVFDKLAKETGLLAEQLYRNTSVPLLYEDALRYEEGTVITANGGLATFSGGKTGRSPKDKRIVMDETVTKDIWWGPVNIPMDEHTFMINRERAVDYLKTRKRIYVFDGFAGWDPKYRIKVRVICARAYHGNMACFTLFSPVYA